MPGLHRLSAGDFEQVRSSGAADRRARGPSGDHDHRYEKNYRTQAARLRLSVARGVYRLSGGSSFKRITTSQAASAGQRATIRVMTMGASTWVRMLLTGP